MRLSWKEYSKKYWRQEEKRPKQKGQDIERMKILNSRGMDHI